VYIPYVGLFACFLLLGILTGQETRGLVPYALSIPVFLFQFFRLTIAGWAAAFVAWTLFCLDLLFVDYRNIRMGIDSINIWLAVGFVLVSTAPFFTVRPRTPRQ
jgi:hypothetical protein